MVALGPYNFVGLKRSLLGLGFVFKAWIDVSSDLFISPPKRIEHVHMPPLIWNRNYLLDSWQMLSPSAQLAWGIFQRIDSSLFLGV